MTFRIREFSPRVYFFLILCANSTVFGMVFGGHAATSAGSTSSALSSGSSDPVLLAINLVLGVSTLVFAFPKAPHILYLLDKTRIIFLLYLFAAMTILWSTSRTDTFRNFAYLALYLIATCYLAVRFDVEEVRDLLAKSLTLLALLSIPASFLLPKELFHEDSWRGVFLTKNGLGSAMAVGMICIALKPGRWTLGQWASFLLSGFLLVMSKSTTAMTVVGLALSALIYMRLNGRLAKAYLSALVGCVLVASLLAGNLAEIFTGAAGKDTTLSGRTAIWVLVAQKIRERPLLGYGYHAFWSTEADSVNQFLNGFEPGQAHNGYLEACLDLGVVGLFFCLAACVRCFRMGVRLNRFLPDRSGDVLILAVIAVLVHNFAESDMMMMSTIWFFFLLAILSGTRQELELRTAMMEEEQVA